MSFVAIIDKPFRNHLLGVYRQRERCFPLIMAVLSGRQEGTIHANDPKAPSCFFVVHRFGFSELCGTPDAGFADALAQHLFVEQSFEPAKIRCYAPENADFFRRFPARCAESQRVQLCLPGPVNKPKGSDGAEPEAITAENVDEINAALGLDLFGRFWKSRSDFLTYAIGSAIRHEGRFASVCCSAAIEDGILEIDVATLPEARNKGLGKLVAYDCIQTALGRGMIPNWDCYTNNDASMRLASSLGFQPAGAPYPFFTIARS